MSDPALLALIGKLANDEVTYFSQVVWEWDKSLASGCIATGTTSLYFTVRDLSR